MATIQVTGTKANVTVAPDSTNVSVVSQPVAINVSAAVVVGNTTIRNALNADAPISYDRIGGVMSFLDRDPVIRGSRVMDPALNPEYAGFLSGNISLDVENYDIWPIGITGNVTAIELANVAVGQEVKIIFTQSSTPGIIDDTSGNYSNWFWVNDNIYIPQTTGAKALLTVTWTGASYIANMQEFGATGQNGIATGTSAPADPGEGWLWFDTTTDTLKVYVSGVWEIAGGGGATVAYGPTAPSTPIQGDLWFDTVANYLKVYTGSVWQSAAVGAIGYTGSQGATGAQGTTGYTGSQGAQGIQGYTGSASIVPGPIGYTGSAAANATLANVLAAGNVANQGASFGNNPVNLGSISFDNSETLQGIASRLRFNNTHKTFDLAETEIIWYQANSAISAGDVLYTVGSTALGVPLLDKANTGNSDFDPDKVIGVAMKTVSSGTQSNAVRSGAYSGNFATGNELAGEVLYLDVNTNGAMTNVEPVAPGPIIVLGTVKYPNFDFIVNISSRPKVEDLSDVNLTGITNGQVLTWDNANSVFVNSTVSGGVGTLDQVLTAGNTSTQGMQVANVNIAGETTLQWDTVDETLAFPLNANIYLNIGETTVLRAKATENIQKGNVVMFAGTQGDHILISKANVDYPGFRSEWIVGVVAETIITNDFTYAINYGRLRNVDTSDFTLGDILWVDPVTPGNLTNVEPAAGNAKILVAAVTNVHTNVGSLFVRLTETPFLNDINDVSITSPTNTQVLAYNSSTGIWTNQTQTGGAGITYVDILDGGAPGFKTGTSVFEADGGNSVINASGDYIYDGGTA